MKMSTKIGKTCAAGAMLFILCASSARSIIAVTEAQKIEADNALSVDVETPICIRNEVGRGRAILLNFTMWSFPHLAVHDGPDAAARFFNALLAEAGVRRPLEVAGEDGRRERNIETMRWRTGEGLEVVALYGPGDGMATGSPRRRPRRSTGSTSRCRSR